MNNEGLLISLKLGTIFISHIVLSYALDDLYLFFIANPDFWPSKYLFETYPGRQACIHKILAYDFDAKTGLEDGQYIMKASLVR